TGDAGRVFARRRIRNDLDVIDGVGRQLIEEVPELCALEWARAAVDLDDDAGVAAQADVVVDVDVDRWNVAQDVERRTTLGRRHVAHDVGRSIRLDLDLLALRGDRLRLELERNLRERNDADVDVGMRRGERDGGKRSRREAKRSDRHAILAECESRNPEAS